jgi:hypothetical protein
MAPGFVFNGVNGLTGGYVTPPLPPEDLARLARGESIDPDLLKALKALNFRAQAHYGVGEGIDADDLASAGWGVIFPHNHDPAVFDALRQLLQRRQDQAARKVSRYYREMTGTLGYQPGESKREFLRRNGALSGQAADPENVPYYLLIVASPEQIPFEFQYQLDVEYAVGRLWFETEAGRPDYDAFARYADSALAAEDGPTGLPRRAVFFGVRNKDDRSTTLSADQLTEPLVERLKGRLTDWDCRAVLAQEATKSRLARLLGGEETPAFLFTASHGMGFPRGDPLQAPHQGALLCQEWPGPVDWHGPIPPGHYFSADDLGTAAQPHGLIAFHFACYGAGTPAQDDFDHVPELRGFSCAAPRPLAARLPQRLLAHPRGGALAAVGHIDRAWSCSFFEPLRLGRQLITFASTIERLLTGHRLGYALEYFNQYHSAVGAELGDVLQKVQKFNFDPDPSELSYLWTTTNDARNFVVVGDPAVRFPAAAPRPETGGPP